MKDEEAWVGLVMKDEELWVEISNIGWRVMSRD